jgi:phosphatidylglycerophosphatase A
MTDKRGFAARLAMLIATWFGSGHLPTAPGTWGSAAALPFAWLIVELIGPLGLLVAAALAYVAGSWAVGVVLRDAGVKDPGWIVIDEVVGQWLTLAPIVIFDPILYFLGFLVFRVLDIVKPWPARWCDRNLPGTAGVMLDDVVAGIYGAVCMGIVVYALNGFGILPCLIGYCWIRRRNYLRFVRQRV